MIVLIQFPWSPFCLVQKRILEYSQAPFRIQNIPPNDRSLVWRLTKQRYYMVPIIKDGKTAVFETDEDSQVIAKYLDEKLNLGLFPRFWRGAQSILWHYFENDIENVAFKLNDAHYREFVRPADRLPYLRHKERKFGRGCLEQWMVQQPALLEELTKRLLPCEQMLMDRPFLLDTRPLFVDFDLFGMLANFLYSGRHAIPATHAHLQAWYARMGKLKRSDVA